MVSVAVFFLISSAVYEDHQTQKMYLHLGYHTEQNKDREIHQNLE